MAKNEKRRILTEYTDKDRALLELQKMIQRERVSQADLKQIKQLIKPIGQRGTKCEV